MARIKTRAEQIMEAKNSLPSITPKVASSVSEYRKDQLQDEMNSGLWRNENGQVKSGSMGHAITSTSSRRIEKMAQLSGSGGSSVGSAWRGSGDTVRQVPDVYSPLWLNSNLNLPRDRITVNAWVRVFVALMPLVQNAITLHSTYPISKMNIKCKDRKVQQFFEDMIDEADLISTCVQIAQEFWTIGEAFPNGELDENTGKWARFVIHNPDFVAVERGIVAGEPIISLKPDENLKRIASGTRPSDIHQRMQLDPAIVEYVRKNQNIPLNNFYVTHIARRMCPYDVRGTGLIVSIFKSLMALDQIKEAKFVQYSQMINPITLVKVGSDSFRPGPTELEAYRQVFEESMYDKNFVLFTQHDVAVERAGFSGGVLDVGADIDKLINEIYAGLMVPKVIIDGSDTTYANGGVAVDVLRQRYTQFRGILSSWLRKKVFAPISQLNGFYEVDGGKRKLIVPEVDWNHMALFDMQDYIGNLMTLANAEPAARKVSVQTLYRSLGLEYEDEMRKMKYEDVQNAIRERELQALGSYSLTELRTLGPNDEIAETKELAVPGEEGLLDDEDIGITPPSGGGGGGGGGMPLPPPPPPKPMSAPPAPAPAAKPPPPPAAPKK